MTSMRFGAFAAVTALAGLTACGPDGPGPNGEPANVPGLAEFWLDAGDGLDHGMLTTLAFDAPATLQVESKLNILVPLTGTFADGATVDLDMVEQVQWSIEDTTLAGLGAKSDGGVEVNGLTEGTTKLVAQIGDLTVSQDLEVLPVALVGLTLSMDGELKLFEVSELTATAEYRDGTTQDVTTTTSFSSSAPEIVTALDDAGRKGLLYATRRGDAIITSNYEDQAATLNVGVGCQLVPSDRIATNSGMPNASWPNAIMYDVDGTQTTRPLSIEEMMCDSSFDQYAGFIFSLNAGWCGPCHAWMRTAAASEQTLDQAGILPVFVVGDGVARGTYSVATVEYADQLSTQHAGNSASIRLGDIETVGLGDPSQQLGGVKQVLSTTNGWPSLFVVRRSDMQVLSLSGGAPPTVDGIVNLVQSNSGGGGSAPATNCMDGDDEATEPNDIIKLAPQLDLGSHPGGICNNSPDFFRIKVDGPWRATLTFTNATADLDMYVWDETTDAIFRNEAGEFIGSFDSRRDFESVEFSGEAVIRIQAKAEGRTAPYTLSIEPR
ncbi:MAG: hypothetical protein AAFZ18_25315 [Myxococcota bacterium]